MISRARYILLNVYHILIDGLFDSIPVLLAFMILSFDEKEAAVGLIVSLGTALSTAAGLGTLVLTRKFRFAHIAALVTAVYGAGFLAASFSTGIVAAGLCFAFAMTGHSIFHNISFSYITRNTDRTKLGRVMGDFIAIGDVGRIPLVSLSAFAAAYSFAGLPGWKVVCFAYGLATLCAAFGLLFIQEKNSVPEPGNSDPKQYLPSFALLKNREVFLSMLASVLNAFSNERVFTFLPLLLLAKGIDPTVIGTFALGFTAGSFLGKMACGRFIDSFGSRKVFIFAELLLTVLLCILLATDSLALIVVIALVLGIVTKGTIPVVQTIIIEPVSKTRTFDDIFSINSFLRGITNMLTPLLFGLMASWWGMNVVYLLMALVAAVAVIPVWMMRRPDPENTEPAQEQDSAGA